MKIIHVSLFVISICFFAACNTTPDNQETAGTAAEDLKDAAIVKPSFINADAKLAAQVQHLYTGYLQIQNALSGDNSAEAAAGAVNISRLIKTFDTTGMPADQGKVYEVLAEKIRESAGNMGNARDIVSQRTAFAVLSDQVYELEKVFGNDRPVYQAHCPMAFDGKGAFWLSDKAKISNPYYGSKMLECGDVVNIVKK